MLKTPRVTRDAILGVVGFVVRYVISFGVCFWLYNFFLLTYVCFGPASSQVFLSDVKNCPFFVIFFSIDPVLFGARPEQSIVSAIVAIPIAIAWRRICRRHCLPVKEWF